MKRIYSLLWCLSVFCVVIAHTSNDSINRHMVKEQLELANDLYTNKGDTLQAEQEYLRAVEMARTLIGEQDSTYADVLNTLGNFYFFTRNFQKSEACFLQGMPICVALFGEQSLQYYILLSNLGYVYLEMGDYQKYEQYAWQSLAVCKVIHGEHHPECGVILHRLSQFYMQIEAYAETEQCILQALEIFQQDTTDAYLDYINAEVGALASRYLRMGDYAKAEYYIRQFPEIQARRVGTQHPDYLEALTSVVGFYYQQKNYVQAEPYAVQLEQTSKVVYGEHSPRHAGNLIALGNIYYDLGNCRKAIYYKEQSAKILEENFMEQTSDYAGALANIGVYYKDLDELATAERYLLKALRISQQNNYPYSYIQVALAGVYHRVGDYKKSGRYMDAALQTVKETYGELSLQYASMLANKGDFMRSIGCDEPAIDYYLQAMRIDAEVLGPSHPNYARDVQALGMTYRKIGDYENAEKYSLLALQIEKEAVGENHPRYAMALNVLGAVLNNMGDYDRALECFTQALQILETAYGKQHPDYATTLNNIGLTYISQGEIEQGEACSLAAAEIDKALFGEKHYTYAFDLNRLGVISGMKGDFKQQEKYFKQALKIREKVLGKSHPEYLVSLNNMASHYEAQKKYKKVEKYLLLSLQEGKKYLGENERLYLMTLSNLGIFYWKIDAYDKALLYFSMSADKEKQFYIHSVNHLSERQRDLYWQTMHSAFDIRYPAFSYDAYPTQKEAGAFAYNNELFKKGLLLASSNVVRRAVLDSQDSTLISQWKDLTNIQQQIQGLQGSSQSPRLTELQEQAESLEKQITQSSTAYRDNQQQWHITWDSVRNALKDGQMAIEYVSVLLKRDTFMYCAIMVRNDSKSPEIVPLFINKEVESMLGARADRLYDYHQDGQPLSHMVWGKVLPYIKPGETVYFAPTGLLHQVAIEALPFDETHTMADMFNLIRLSSTREIAMHKTDHPHTTATLYGGIQYDMDSTGMLTESMKYIDVAVNRSLEDTLNRGNIAYLPGTMREVERIYDLLQSDSLRAQLYTATNANEESFKALSGTHQNILHVATHGFYWTDSMAQQREYFSQRLMTTDNPKPDYVTIDPLNRCGLLFAGAQMAWSGHSAELPEGVQDGILTAKEISLLDLRDADLVVLSACETGKGEITGEGVFGLQRAFKQAGAQTIIMSLWPVNDAATQLLMTEFYKNWITNHQSKRDAFRNAQNTVRAKYEEPVYWAGFVMMD